MEIMKTDRKGRRRDEENEPGGSETYIEYEREDRKKRDGIREARRSGRDRSCYLAAVWQRHQLADATMETFSSGPAGPTPRPVSSAEGKF